ncbi:hypothetical protein CDD81_1452 [Ophiocordyceps australis]|uniref:GST C-terminal domain-containing protein n=1 Tax=Ophiocordyceps australis TaxID=1399860 RepID=A0A2C5Y8B3_9HYPO|nr:hypothetical protein CDD81_1452 [Ophiocordyceps australis]
MEIAVQLTGWFQPLVGWREYNKASVDKSSQAALKAVNIVETHLSNRAFLVGETLSAADYVCAGLVYRGFQYFFDRNWRQHHPNVSQWYEVVTSQPAYLATTEKLQLLEQPALVNKPPSETTIRINRLRLSKTSKVNSRYILMLRKRDSGRARNAKKRD